jgi:hypothetical protein
MPTRPSTDSSPAVAVDAAVYASALRAELPGALARSGARLDKASMERLASHLSERLARNAKLAALASAAAHEAKAAGREDPWISTQVAADQSGFSRPFIAALLDSGAYDGEIHRSPRGGHRKVRASEFQAWLARHADKADAPRTLAQVRAQTTRTPPPRTPAPDSGARAASRARASALAKRLGIA